VSDTVANLGAASWLEPVSDTSAERESCRGRRVGADARRAGRATQRCL